MDKQPIRDEQIIEALEACRPGSDDLADPDFAHLAAAMAADPSLEELHQRLQKTDAVLACTIQDVPVPDGLARRLSERLATAAEENVETAPQPAVRPKRVSRRWLLVGSGSLIAAVVLVAVAVSFLTPQAPTITSAAVLQEGINFFNEESPETGSDEDPPAAYPFSSAVLDMPGTRWRWIRGKFLQSKGVAYDLSGPGGTTATLYVVRRSVTDALSSPPLRPGLTTAGFSVSTWQSDKLLYVLVVHGNSATYQRFLNLSRGPLT